MRTGHTIWLSCPTMRMMMIPRPRRNTMQHPSTRPCPHSTATCTHHGLVSHKVNHPFSPTDLFLPSSLVIADADPIHSFLSDIAAFTERHTRSSPSPPKRDSPPLSQSPETIEGTLPFCAERAFDGPGLGLNDNRHWLEAEEEDGFACWTAYANDDQSTTSVIVVRECRW